MLLGDHLLMLELPYGPNTPSTKYRFPQLRTPNRARSSPFAGTMEPDEKYLKRVIAVAGDTVEIRRGVSIHQRRAHAGGLRASSPQPPFVMAGEHSVRGEFLPDDCS